MLTFILYTYQKEQGIGTVLVRQIILIGNPRFINLPVLPACLARSHLLIMRYPGLTWSYSIEEPGELHASAFCPCSLVTIIDWSQSMSARRAESATAAFWTSLSPDPPTLTLLRLSRSAPLRRELRRNRVGAIYSSRTTIHRLQALARTTTPHLLWRDVR